MANQDNFVVKRYSQTLKSKGSKPWCQVQLAAHELRLVFTFLNGYILNGLIDT